MLIDHIITDEEQLIYDESQIIEIAGDHVPNTFEQWKDIFDGYGSKCLFWLTECLIVMKQDDLDWLQDLVELLPSTWDSHFPDPTLMLWTRNDCPLVLFATVEMEAFGLLHEMVTYPDFSSRCEGIVYSRGNQLGAIPTLLMKEILEKTEGMFTLCNILFRSEFSGRVLATSGRNTSIMFRGCEFLALAEEAFLQAMTTKADENMGLTDIYMYKAYPFNKQTLLRLLQRNELKTLALYGYSYGHTPPVIFDPHTEQFLEELLEAIGSSRRLENFKVPYCTDFASYESYVNFINGLRSESLRHLHIEFYGCEDKTISLPVDCLSELSLTNFSFNHVILSRTRWNKLLEELGKCTMLPSLTLKYASWREVYGRLAAVEFQSFLKVHPNIDTLETEHFFDTYTYTKCIVPTLEHNWWHKRIQSLLDNDLRSALVAEALARVFASKPSQRYTLIRENTDVIASYLALHHRMSGKQAKII